MQTELDAELVRCKCDCTVQSSNPMFSHGGHGSTIACAVLMNTAEASVERLYPVFKVYQETAVSTDYSSIIAH